MFNHIKDTLSQGLSPNIDSWRQASAQISLIRFPRDSVIACYNCGGQWLWQLGPTKTRQYPEAPKYNACLLPVHILSPQQTHDEQL